MIRFRGLHNADSSPWWMRWLAHSLELEMQTLCWSHADKTMSHLLDSMNIPNLYHWWQDSFTELLVICPLLLKISSKIPRSFFISKETHPHIHFIFCSKSWSLLIGIIALKSFKGKVGAVTLNREYFITSPNAKVVYTPHPLLRWPSKGTVNWELMISSFGHSCS